MKEIRLSLLIVSVIIWYSCGNAGNEKSRQTAPPQTETATPPASTETTHPVQDAPVTTPVADQTNNTVRLVQLTLRDTLKADLEKGFIDSASRVFKYSEYDLNGDGKKEIFVGLAGSNFCGSGGCTMYLLDNQGSTITRFTVTNYPVIISESKTNGWSDLIIESNGNRLVKFNGTKYPSNPSTQPKYAKTPGDELPRMLVWDNTPSFSY